MALRTSKITSEIIQTCNKYLSSNAEASIRNKVPPTISSETESSRSQRPFRYKIANTEKPQGLPQLSFHEEGTTLFSELQPCANPEFKFDYNPPKWAEKPTDNSPFPASIKQKPRLHLTYSDQQKAEDKFVQYKNTFFNPTSRNYSTFIVRHYSRAPADNSSKGNCKQKLGGSCVKPKRECKLNANKHCPRFSIKDCKQSKGSNCDLRYLDPHCVKKFAPYPSYSEACAETLPDDPSECQQCPWRVCDGADTIKPGKPVRHKRHYSTSCNRHYEANGGVVVGPLLPSTLAQVQEHICEKCGVTKSPCKEPPGPCEVRRQIEEKKRSEKSKHDEGSKKKKASDVEDAMILSSLNGRNHALLSNSCDLNLVRMLDGPSLPKKNSWVDVNEGLEVLLNKKQKHPNCHKKKKPKRPKGTDIDKDNSIEYGDVDWWSGRGKKTIITEPLDTNIPLCKIDKCGKQHIRNKQGLLLSRDTLLLDDKKGGKKRIKGDEGHPPPCPDHIEDSKNCPDKPLKKPKFKKRPMSESFYKRPEDPYSPSE